MTQGDRKNTVRVNRPLTIAAEQKCMFGLKCYRRNPAHFESYSHPHLESLLDGGDDLERGLRGLVNDGADEKTLRDQVPVIHLFSLLILFFFKCYHPEPRSQ
jgi:hypothetical protein